jgi:ceramide glucosyltransferase
MTLISHGLLLLAALGLLFAAVQCAATWIHVRRPCPAPSRRPAMSILKPLCGLDDDLRSNIETFAALDYPEYEVLLGVRDPGDAAYALALEAQALWPDRVRVVVQRAAPGMNPKVNQLITLAAAARHDVLVVSDSNVRVDLDYLDEIARHFEDPTVGLVTHPVAGVGERALGALLDNLHLTTTIGPGMVGAKLVGGKDLVVGKSMAMRREDLAVLGGFEAIKDVLGEDWVTGQLVRTRLAKRVVVAARAIQNVTRHRSVGEFVRRYARWGTIQRTAVGTGLYSLLLLLNPVALATLAVAAAPSAGSLGALGATGLLKAVIDGVVARALRPGGVPAARLLLAPAKDLFAAAAWAIGLVSSEVSWRGNRFRVLAGTRLRPIPRAVQEVFPRSHGPLAQRPHEPA